MATKAEERKALEQIKKIVDGLGKYSYIATAFDGCFEIARDNIENDFACSLKDRAEMMESRYDEVSIEASRISEENKKLKDELDYLKGSIDRNKKVADEWQSAYQKVAQEANDMTAKADALEDEIIRLKAKLYDMMTS